MTNILFILQLFCICKNRFFFHCVIINCNTIVVSCCNFIHSEVRCKASVFAAVLYKIRPTQSFVHIQGLDTFTPAEQNFRVTPSDCDNLHMFQVCFGIWRSIPVSKETFFYILGECG